VTIPGNYGDVSQNMRVQIDVVVRRSILAEIIRERSANGSGLPIPVSAWRVTPQQLGELIDARLATLCSPDVTEALAELAGIDPVADPQPRVLHVRTTRPVVEVLNTDGLRPIPGAGVSMGAHLLADPARDLSDIDERRAQVMDWLTQIALDAGLRGMQKLLQDIVSAQASA
jgi:hypothetical protein